MLVFVLNQAQKANTGKIQTPVYENVREFGLQSRVSIPRLSFCLRRFARGAHTSAMVLVVLL